MKWFEKLRSGWHTWPLSARVSVSAATLFAAASAFTDVRSFIKDIFASPEKQLTELGYSERTYDEFLRAIANRHIEAVELFGQIDCRLKPEQFGEIFDDRFYHVGVVEALIDGHSIGNEHCPTEGPHVAVYTVHAGNPEKAGILRGLCSNDRVIGSLRSSLQSEQTRLEASAAHNASRTQTLNECASRYLREGEQRMIEAAARFSILSRDTYSERECVLAKLNVALLSGDPALSSGPDAFQSYVTDCCSRYNPEAKVDTTTLQALEQAIGFLQGE